MSAQLDVVGQSVGRSDAVGHVTGGTRYTSDRTFPGMLHLKMVRSPLHHARIKGVDLTEAERVPGFVRALTAADVPHNRYTILSLIGVEPEEEFVLAEDRVRFKGEAIVAIVAETEEAAIEAVSKVRLDLEELPAVFDVEEALKPGAPIVTHWGNNTFMYEGHPCRRVRFGDVEAAFARADHIVEGVYNTSPIEQAPLETTGCIAVPEAGRFTVYTNTQALYFSLDNTSIILQVPGNRLHFVGGTVGGGFGGKVDVIVEPIATLAAMKTGRPVRFVYSRSEEMQVSSTRSAWRIYLKDGVTRDGHIIARKVTSYADSGAYSRQTPYALTKHAANAAGPYAIPNVSIDAYCVYTNRQPTSAMRGFGVTMASFALEVQMDKIAEAVGLDPVDDPVHQRLPQRRHEAASQAGGGRDPDRDDAGGRGPRRARAAGRIPGDDVRAARHRRARRPIAMAKLRGTGIAAVNYPTGMNLGGDPSQALIHATTSGSFVVTLSATDLGQGLRTVIGQIAAETLGIAFGEVVVDTADTDTGPHDMGTFASRATHRVGNAVIAAAVEARKALLEVAAEEFEASVDEIEFDGHGNLKVKGVPARSMKVAEIASLAQFKYGRTIAGRGSFMKPKSEVDPETGAMDPDSTEAHACTVAEVEVDTETGEVAVLSIRSAYEVGRQVNPALVQGQIIGGAWMGMSHALYETTSPYYPDPDHSPRDFSEYLMPGPLELPDIDCVVLEMPSANGPYGVKGIGEMTANSPIPAIVNAIYHATGVRIDELPVTPEKILRGLDAGRA